MIKNQKFHNYLHFSDEEMRQMNLKPASALGTEPVACDFTKLLFGGQSSARRSPMQASAVTPAITIFFSTSILIAFVHLSDTSAVSRSCSELVLFLVWMAEEKLWPSQPNANLLLFYTRGKEPAITETSQQPVFPSSQRPCSSSFWGKVDCLH